MQDDKFKMDDIYPRSGDFYTSMNNGKCGYSYVSKNGNAPLGSYADYDLDNFEDKNDVDTFRRMNKDINDYVNGKSQYVKGKGWH